MLHFKSKWIMAACFSVLLTTLAAWAFATPAPNAPQAGEVRVGARTAIVFLTHIAGISAGERADIVNRRVEKILSDSTINPSQIQAQTMPDGNKAIVVGDFVITGVTEDDAEAAAMPVDELADKWAHSLRSEITQLQPLYLRRGNVDVKMLSEHRVLLLVLQVALLLLVARVCGEIMSRLGQPPVIGQLLAGILLGHSFLGTLWPDLHALVFPIETTQGYLLEVVSWIGVIFLLMLTGLETDLALVRKQGKPAIWASVSGIILPFLFGFGAIWMMPEELLIFPNQRLIIGLFLGTALSISSVPVIAKILMDMKLMRRDIGQVILAAAIADDTVGWIILAMVAGLAANGMFSAGVLGKALIGTAAFIAFSLTLGRKITFKILRWVNDHATTKYALLTTVIIMMLFSASITQFIGVHAVLGAFIFGVVLNTSPLIGRKITEPIEAMTDGVFAPIFFAAAGLHVSLDVMLNPSLLLITLLLTAVACAGKIIGCYFGGIRGGLGKWESLSLGLGMNARGAMGLIIAILGFSLGLLTVNLFSIIVVMALLTTAMTPPLLRWSLAHVTPSKEEQERLDKEKKQAGSFMGRIRRVLLPSRGGRGAALAAQIIMAIAREQPIEVTAIHIVPPNGDTNGNGEKSTSLKKREETIFSKIAETLKGTKATLVKRTLQGHSPATVILNEMQNEYNLLAIGCGKVEHTSDVLFGRVVDEVALECPAPLLVVYAGGEDDDTESETDTISPLRHILVLASGVEHSQRAVELAVSVAHSMKAKVTAMHIVERQNELLSRVVHRNTNREAAHESVKFATELGKSFDVQVEGVVRRSKHAAPEIVRYAEQNNVDLILLSGTLRPARHMFMGPTVTYVLDHAPCAVAVLKPHASKKEPA